jgi:hypothetical protein
METEPMSVRRRPNTWLLVMLGVVVVGLVGYSMWPASPTAPAPATPARARGTRPAERDRFTPQDLDVKLDALEAKRPTPGEIERNPFRFRPAPVPPPPPPVATGPPPPVAPIQPPTPQTPPIPLKFMGTVEGPGIRLAALTDCKGFTYSGREGEAIDGRFRLVRIQTESIVIEYLNGTGRTTMRKSGECSPMQGR